MNGEFNDFDGWLISGCIQVPTYGMQLARPGHQDPAAGTKQSRITGNSSDISNELDFEMSSI